MDTKETRESEMTDGEPILKSVPATVIKGVTERTFTFTFSSADVDRDNDIITQKGIDLKAFRKNPVLLWAHSHSAPPIGMVESTVLRAGNLTGMVRLLPEGVSEMADLVNAMLTEGFPLATSIGFIPKESVFDETRGGFNFLKIELMEISIVPVPSNRSALRLAAAAKQAGPGSEIVKWASEVLKAAGSNVREDVKETSVDAELEPVGEVIAETPAAEDIVVNPDAEPDDELQQEESVEEKPVASEAVEHLMSSEEEPASLADGDAATEGETPEPVEAPIAVAAGVTLEVVEKMLDEKLDKHFARLEKSNSVPAPKTLDSEVSAEAIRLLNREKVEKVVANVAAVVKTEMFKAVRERVSYHTGQLLD